MSEEIYLIFGGAAQGKIAYAKSSFAVNENEIHSLREGEWPLPNNSKRVVISDLECWVEGSVDMEEETVLATLDQECSKFAGQQLILIMEERGCGIVPLGARERRLRERCGIVLRHLAEKARRVDRVMAGLGICLKYEEGAI